MGDFLCTCKASAKETGPSLGASRPASYKQSRLRHQQFWGARTEPRLSVLRRRMPRRGEVAECSPSETQPRHGTRARWWLRLRTLSVAASVAAGSTARAEPVLHEYIELGPGQGPVEPTISGQRANLPNTPGQPPELDPSPGEDGAGLGNAASDSVFSIDRDTARPDRVSYSDPFTPTVVPFKRMLVYDSVNRDADLIVRDSNLVRVKTFTKSRANDEHFHASLSIDATSGQRIAIPSVAPGARLVLAHSDPPTELHIGMDSAENWFVQTNISQRMWLTLQVVADRRVFGSEFRDSSWSDLGHAMPSLPPLIKASGLDVARALGVAPTARPREAVARLVEHFRRFSPSTRLPKGQGLALYRELALTARGICRHRSYAFMITALGLGIPSRLALNEAHAWVEVFDGELWHRIDLGGAAEQLDADDEGRPRHVEPRDPFAWPDPSESGLALAERRATPSPADAPQGSAGTAASPPPEPPAASPTPSPEPARSGEPEPGTELGSRVAPAPGAIEPPEEQPPSPPLPELTPLPQGSVALNAGAARAERGKGLFVSGQVSQGRQACSTARIDVVLGGAKGELIPLGTLVSDEQGQFRGHLVIPWNAPLGHHTVMASAAGNCGRPLEIR